MVPSGTTFLKDRSNPDSPSYALRAALAERLAAHRAKARDAGAGIAQLLPSRESVVAAAEAVIAPGASLRTS